MDWRVKGIIQKVLGALPGGHALHFHLQRRFGGLRDFDGDLSDVLAIVSNAQFCRPMQAFWSAWEAILAQDGLCHEDSMIISLAIGGTKMHRIVNRSLTDELRDKLFERLLELASGQEDWSYEINPGQWEHCVLNAWKGEG